MISHEIVASALAGVRAPLFLADEIDREGRSLIRLHTTERSSARRLRGEAEAALAGNGVDADCRVVVHSAASLRRKRSVEALDRSLRKGRIVLDPTGSVARGSAVLACAAMLRARTGFAIKGIFLNAWRRTLYVVLDRASFPSEARTLLEKRVEALKDITGAVGAWRAETCPDFDLAIRVGFELPSGADLIPVDRASASRALRRELSPRGRRRGLVATLASMLGIGAVAQVGAADISIAPSDPYGPPASATDPAVLAPNMSVSLIGGWGDGTGTVFDDAFGAARFKGTIPLGHSFGAQLDAAVATGSYYGVAGHLFWRDPNLGLVGVFAAHENFDGADLNRFGVEASAYMGNITLTAKAAMMDGDAATGDFFGRADVTFYATPNFLVSGGAQYTDDFVLGRVGLEWQPAVDLMPGMSVFADGEFGENDYTRVMAGVTFHFGTAGASLIDRDRRYDPTPEVLGNGYGEGEHKK